ncbi:MAG: phosphoadenylyl-sulfate reductase [Bacteroidetes bacterium]|nr:phosphoadenylyl-sulfate reductase [Bacteroidota bacterium]
MPEIPFPVDTWNRQFEQNDASGILTFFLQYFGGKIAFSSSMGAEDQVITHMISRINPKTSIFTLDTGRLFPETCDLIQSTGVRYGINIKVYFPDTAKVEEMVTGKGINLFYESVENRKLCCHIRKIEPLKRAFSGLSAWVSGLRKSQSVTRNGIQTVEWDETNRLVKINPLASWTEEQVWNYIKENKIPYNPLHSKGYPSIGCMPCTRAIFPGEDIRAGRWWWENSDSRECGLHVKE